MDPAFDISYERGLLYFLMKYSVSVKAANLIYRFIENSLYRNLDTFMGL